MPVRCTLGDLAFTRSGDKGSSANVGVWTRSGPVYRLLVDQLTAERVRAHFAPLIRGEVHRYELANLQALNFVLLDALDGGGSKTLRSDAQGKTYGLALSLISIEIPDDMADLIRPPAALPPIGEPD